MNGVMLTNSSQIITCITQMKLDYETETVFFIIINIILNFKILKVKVGFRSLSHHW